MVDIRQGRRERAFFADGSVGTVAAELMAGGSLPVVEGEWLVGGRRTHAHDVLESLLEKPFPYRFHDVHGQLTVRPRPDQDLRFSFLRTADEFASYPLGHDWAGPLDLDVRTAWRNDVASANWSWAGATWSSQLGAAWSGYQGVLELGDYRGDYLTRNSLGIGVLELELQHRGDRHRLHFGGSLQRGRVDLVGSEGGGYIDGGRESEVSVGGVFAELTLEPGWLRVVPAVRIDHDFERGELMVQPRASARIDLSDDVSVTGSLGRTTQRLHTAHDARMVLPGAPLWVAPGRDEPITKADILSAAATWWLGNDWSAEAGAYHRRFRDVPVWFPEGSRELRTFRFDDGTASGLELLLRRRHHRLSGWIAYGYAVAEYQDRETALSYHPGWDRRHALDAAVFSRLKWGLEVSGRISYGTGVPFWAFAGNQPIARLTPLNGQLFWGNSDYAPYWSREQMRMPQHFRADLGVRWEFGLYGVRIEPFASLLNATARPNVLYYRPEAGPQWEGDIDAPIPPPRLVPVTASSTNFLPSFGVNARF